MRLRLHLLLVVLFDGWTLPSLQLLIRPCGILASWTLTRIPRGPHPDTESGPVSSLPVASSSSLLSSFLTFFFGGFFFSFFSFFSFLDVSFLVLPPSLVGSESDYEPDGLVDSTSFFFLSFFVLLSSAFFAEDVGVLTFGLRALRAFKISA